MDKTKRIEVTRHNGVIAYALSHLDWNGEEEGWTWEIVDEATNDFITDDRQLRYDFEDAKMHVISCMKMAGNFDEEKPKDYSSNENELIDAMRESARGYEDSPF